MSHTFWLTGLSGAGKSTIANAVLDHLQFLDKTVYILDGDILRTGLCNDLKFSKEDRHENLRRAASVASILNAAGVIVVAAFITPYESDREMIRSIIGPDKTSIVYIATPLDVCEARDVKGMYKLARAGKIPTFTGVSDPYEIPQNPDLTLQTNEYTDTHDDTKSIDSTAETLSSFIWTRTTGTEHPYLVAVNG